MFDCRYVNIAYGTLLGFIAPDEEGVYRPALDDDEEWALYHPKKKTCKGVTLEIPENIQEIGSGALENCFALTGVTMPESVSSIGASAFRGCNNLHEITFSSKLKVIGKEAFAYCSGLAKLYVPDSVETIGIRAFEHCNNLVEIRLPDAFSRQLKRIFGDDVDRMFLDMYNGKLKVNPRLAAALMSYTKGKWYAAVEKHIAQSQKKKKTDMTALLMEYKRQHYPPAGGNAPARGGAGDGTAHSHGGGRAEDLRLSFGRGGNRHSVVQGGRCGHRSAGVHRAKTGDCH